MPAQRQGRGGLGRCDTAPKVLSWLSEGRREFSKQEREKRTLQQREQLRQGEMTGKNLTGLV